MVVLGGTFRLLTLEDIGCKEELPETQDTIAGNAWQKAKYVWEHYKISCFAESFNEVEEESARAIFCWGTIAFFCSSAFITATIESC